jgi:hypothetical protein
MDYTDSSPDAKSNPHPAALDEYVLRASQQIQQMRRQTKVAQRAAAESFEKSAGTHDRIVSSYEKLAEFGEGEQYLERATRHREFAHEDRRIAERLRRMAD